MEICGACTNKVPFTGLVPGECQYERRRRRRAESLGIEKNIDDCCKWSLESSVDSASGVPLRESMICQRIPLFTGSPPFGRRKSAHKSPGSRRNCLLGNSALDGLATVEFGR